MVFKTVVSPEKTHMHLDVLAFGTHPDDVELFCGGTVIKLVRQGYRVGVIDLTRGEMSTRGTPQLRRQETAQATVIMNLAIRENAGLPDGNIANTPENRLKIIGFLRQYQPKTVLIPYSYDRHPDHVHAGVLLSEAIFYSGLAKINDGHEPYRPQQVISYYHHWVDNVTVVVDISAEFEDKKKAITAYRSQFHDPDSREAETYISSKAFMESIENRARYFGDQIGTLYGEPFFLKTPIKINNLLGLCT